MKVQFKNLTSLDLITAVDKFIRDNGASVQKSHVVVEIPGMSYGFDFPWGTFRDRLFINVEVDNPSTFQGSMRLFSSDYVEIKINKENQE